MSGQYPPQGAHENNDNSQIPQQPFYGNNPQQPYNPQLPYPYQQPPTQYNPQLMPVIPPQYPYPQQAQQSQYQQPQGQQKKKRKTVKEQWNSGPSGKCGVIAACAILLFVVFACSGIMHAATSGSQDTTTTQNATSATIQPTTASKPVVVATTKPTPKPKPTPTPKPTASPAQLEALYKSITTNTTVDTLDKDGAVDKGHDVHFTGRLLKFVKDDSGNTAGANVDDPNTATSSVIQIVFPTGTDITQLNEGDTIEVWGTNAGVFSGTNAFGGNVQEVGIAANYLTDQTTGYKTGV